MIGFGQPLALVALPLVPLVWVLGRYASSRRRRADVAYGGGPLIRPPRGRVRDLVGEALLLAALVVLVLAAARPTWGHEPTPLVRRGIDVVIALDVSRSMSARDVEPSRADVAVSGLRRLLRALPGDRVGLVTFAGTAFPRSPLTLDLDALSQLLAQAQGEAGLVDRGTDLALAIEGALESLSVEDRAPTQVIVLVSDGEHVGRDLDVALRHARDLGVRVYTVAAGTEAGAPLGGDPRNGPDVSRLDRATLERIARETGGSARGLTSIAGLAVEFSRLRQASFDDTSEDAPIERFPWFIAGALALLLARTGVTSVASWGPRVATRRAIGLGLTALVSLLAACGGTAAWRAVDEGNRAYNRAQFEQALAAYDRAAQLAPDEAAIAYNQGNTLHALHRYDEASIASKTALDQTEDAHLRNEARYALGNHAFRRGDLVAARESYTAVLLADPGDEDARYNLELVLALQRQQRAPQGAPGDQAGPNPEANRAIRKGPALLSRKSRRRPTGAAGRWRPAGDAGHGNRRRSTERG
ncbi:MAG: VWA domain-containing protein [Dehalococcoidia bacterium]